MALCFLWEADGQLVELPVACYQFGENWGQGGGALHTTTRGPTQYLMSSWGKWVGWKGKARRALRSLRRASGFASGPLLRVHGQAQGQGASRRAIERCWWGGGFLSGATP